MIGWKLLEQQVVDAKAISRFATDEELFRALEHDLIDVAIIEKSQGTVFMQKNTSLHVVEPPLLKQTCYLYLNKKNALLMPKISSELKKMKQNGSYDKIFNDVMRPYKLEHEYISRQPIVLIKN